MVAEVLPNRVGGAGVTSPTAVASRVWCTCRSSTLYLRAEAAYHESHGNHYNTQPQPYHNHNPSTARPLPITAPLPPPLPWSRAFPSLPPPRIALGSQPTIVPLQHVHHGLAVGARHHLLVGVFRIHRLRRLGLDLARAQRTEQRAIAAVVGQGWAMRGVHQVG